MRKLWNNQKGYFTVEASFLVPMAFFLVLGILYVSFYIYDLSVARNFLNQEVALITDTTKTNGRVDTGKFKQKNLLNRSITYMLKSSYSTQASEGKKLLKKKLQKQLIVSKVSKLTIKAGQVYIKGSLTLSCSIPIPVIGNLIGKVWKNTVSVTMENGNQVEDMRRWEMLE